MPTLKPDGKRLNGRGSGWISKTRRLAIYLRDEFRCVYCQRDLHQLPPRQVTLDHLLPQSQGGTHADRNLVTACFDCNSRRQHEKWVRFARQFPGAVERVVLLRRRVPNLKLARSLRTPAPAGAINLDSERPIVWNE